MKLKYRLLSVLLLSLPVVSVTLFWDRLPVRLPMHFNNEGQPDRFGNRQELLGMLLLTLFILNSIRAVLLIVVSKQPGIQPMQRLALYLLTAGFIAGTLSLLILQGLYQSPLYVYWLPVLFFLFGSSFIYFAVPPDLPTTLKDPAISSLPIAQRIETLQRIHTMSRLVVLRVNLLAVVLMIFADVKDRWSIGVLANLLAYSALFIISVFLHRRSD